MGYWYAFRTAFLHVTRKAQADSNRDSGVFFFPGHHFFFQPSLRLVRSWVWEASTSAAGTVWLCQLFVSKGFFHPDHPSKSKAARHWGCSEPIHDSCMKLPPRKWITRCPSRKDKVNRNLALSVHYLIYQLTHKSMTLHRLAPFAAIKSWTWTIQKTQKKPTSM